MPDRIKVIKWDELQKGQRVYTPEGDALGAWPKGTRIRKINSASGDLTGDGMKGTVYSSLGPYDEEPFKGMYAYWVTWDKHPALPCGIRSDRIELDTEGDA